MGEGLDGLNVTSYQQGLVSSAVPSPFQDGGGAGRAKCDFLSTGFGQQRRPPLRMGEGLDGLN